MKHQTLTAIPVRWLEATGWRVELNPTALGTAAASAVLAGALAGQIRAREFIKPFGWVRRLCRDLFSRGLSVTPKPERCSQLMGSAVVSTAPVGVPPTGRQRTPQLLTSVPTGAWKLLNHLFGETPNRATEPVALPFNCIVPAKVPPASYVFSAMVGTARCAVPARVVAGGTNDRVAPAIRKSCAAARACAAVATPSADDTAEQFFEGMSAVCAVASAPRRRGADIAARCRHHATHTDGRGNNQTRLSQLPKRLDTPTDGGRFSLSHPYLLSAVVARANGARTSVRRKVGKRRNLEISKRRSAVPVFLRDKSRAPGARRVCALNTHSHPMGEGRGEGECVSKSEVVFARVLRRRAARIRLCGDFLNEGLHFAERHFEDRIVAGGRRGDKTPSPGLLA